MTATVVMAFLCGGSVPGDDRRIEEPIAWLGGQVRAMRDRQHRLVVDEQGTVLAVQALVECHVLCPTEESGRSTRAGIAMIQECLRGRVGVGAAVDPAVAQAVKVVLLAHAIGLEVRPAAERRLLDAALETLCAGGDRWSAEARDAAAVWFMASRFADPSRDRTGVLEILRESPPGSGDAGGDVLVLADAGRAPALAHWMAAVHQSGGVAWRQWQWRVDTAVLGAQQQDGSWTPAEGEFPERVTAERILTLATCIRYTRPAR